MQQAGLAGDPEVMALAEGLAEKYRQSVKYSLDSSGEGNLHMAADSPPSVAVLHFHGQRAFANPSAGITPVFALVRGVLYALDGGTGTLSWVRRVGTDTTLLPLRVPATAVSPPLVVVASALDKEDLARSWEVQPSEELDSLPSEVGRLLAFHAGDGSLQWWQVLPESCAGQPLLLGNRLLVCGRGGTVFEIDALSGKAPRQLSPGPGSLPRRCSPTGYQLCLFCCGTRMRLCGGCGPAPMRRHPIYRPSERFLALCPDRVAFEPRRSDRSQQARTAVRTVASMSGRRPAGHQCTELRAADFGSPRPAVRLGDRLPGRTWYPPLFNPEQFTMVTDAGAFAAYGLRQRDNRDPDVFTLLRESLGRSLSPSGDRPLPIHADGRNFWVLAQGRLHHFQVSMSPQDGWKIISRPLPMSSVGSALHGAQIQLDDQGRTTAYLVTESPDGRACLVSAVDLDQQAIRWQRQIGFFPQNLPAAIGGKVLAWDRSGGFAGV